MKNKYPIYSDTHFNFTLPWTTSKFVSRLLDTKPNGLILTGDIACGLTIKNTLELLAKKLEIPIYFIVGNHDYYGVSFSETNSVIRELTGRYKNLFWMTDIEDIALKENIGIIGDDGWYDGRLGNSAYLAYNFDWIMISEFRKLKSFDEKMSYGQSIADKSTAHLKIKLEAALAKYQTVYMLTHMPPWAEATRSMGTATEPFWLPYNVNYGLGQMIEDVMKTRSDKNVIVLAGHTHIPAIVHVSHNIECVVHSGKYLGAPTEHNCLFI